MPKHQHTLEIRADRVVCVDSDCNYTKQPIAGGEEFGGDVFEFWAIFNSSRKADLARIQKLEEEVATLRRCVSTEGGKKT